MNKIRIPMVGGDEYDGLSRCAHKIYKWRPGQRKAIKTKYNRRVRRKMKYDVDLVAEMCDDEITIENDNESE